MKNIRLTIAYKGTDFSGWQSQTNGDAIQDRLIEAIHKVTQCRVTLTGAGRTDAGVHALGQVANFQIDHELEPRRYKHAMNDYLPDDIRVTKSEETQATFDSRRKATFRRYRYLIGSEQTPLYRQLRWEIDSELDFNLLCEAARLIVGVHDFAPFCVAKSLKRDNRCEIFLSRWRQIGPLLVYEIRGNRFLHQMVRSLVGAMVNLAGVGSDENSANLTLDRLADILTSPDGERVVFTAPARGLYLVSVGYNRGTK